MEDKYFCTECNSFTDRNHRCEQWSNITRIPKEAIVKLQSQKVTLEQAKRRFIKSLPNGAEEKYKIDPIARGVIDCRFTDYLQALKDFNILEDGE